MGKRKLRWIEFTILAVGCAVIAVVAFHRPNDALDELRAMGAIEVVKGQGWREFQFVEPCSVVESKLSGWKSRLEGDYVMTDPEDREGFPDLWAPKDHNALRPPLHLPTGRNCGFEIVIVKQPSWFERLLKRFGL